LIKTAAAHEHQLDDAGGAGKFVETVLDAAVVHSHHFDVAIDPFRTTHAEIAELDVLPGDVAADALADGAVGGLGRQRIQGVAVNVRVFFEEFFQLAAVDGNPRVLDANRRIP